MKIGYEFMLDAGNLPEWMLWVGGIFLLLFVALWAVIAVHVFLRFLRLREGFVDPGYRRRMGTLKRDRQEARRRGFKL